MNEKHYELLLNELNQKFDGDIDKYLVYLKDKFIELNSTNEIKDEVKPKQVDYSKLNKIISLKKINKYYKKGSENIQVLKDLDLDIYEGEIIALIGPSGSGKSTLLNLLGGLDSPNSGEIIIDSKNLSEMSDVKLSTFRNETIGFIFQFFNLQNYLTVQENVEIPLIFRCEKKSVRNKISQESVESVGLGDRITHRPSELSGGQMQRVAIARSLVNEPTGNLDRKTGIEIMSVIKQINKDLKTTIVIVTHDEFIANQADRFIKMLDGKII